MGADLPEIVKQCDRPGQKNPARCRKLAKALHCARNPGDPWCKEQREKRQRDRLILLALGAAIVAAVYLSPRPR